jgi:uncharacterized membrane protein YraQ (UPF0718 family)
MGYFQSLWNFINASSPYLVLGLLASGVIHQFLSVDVIKKWLGRGKISDVFKAAIVGIPLPLCSCSVIPTAVTLRKSGASNGATSAFLISTPESGVDSIAMTYALMDFPMTVLRPLVAFITAFVAGIMQIWFNNFELPPEEMEQKKSCCHGKEEASVVKETFYKKLNNITSYGFGKLTNDLAGWLTIGILLGALIDYLVPADFFTTLGPNSSRLMILVIGVPLYICASATTPIAASLILKGLSPGAALLLLLVGPATNVSNIMVVQKYIGKRGMLINIFSIIFVSLSFSYLVDYLYANYWTINVRMEAHLHNEGHGFIRTTLSVFLIYLLLKGNWFDVIKPRIKYKMNKGGLH